MLDHGQIAALGIGVPAIQPAAEHKTALVRLADIEMPGPEGDHAVHQRLQPLGYEGLQHMAFNRHVNTGHLRQS